VVDLLRAQKTHVLETVLAWGQGYQREPFFCFPSWGGTPMLPMDMTIRLRQIMRQAKVADRQPTHGWRHTSATLLIHSGENVKTVQARLGHSTPAITMALYVKPTARPPSFSARCCRRQNRPRNKRLDEVTARSQQKRLRIKNATKDNSSWIEVTTENASYFRVLAPYPSRSLHAPKPFGAVLKTGVPARVPWVRIPPLPPKSIDTA
jgi:hypothetical protein